MVLFTHTRWLIYISLQVYFFDCSEAPFEIKADSAIMSWEMGLALGYHMGRTAYAHGKRRYKQFQMAVSIVV